MTEIVSKEKVTPMMQQYLTIKESYPDTILFYRLGDFYEMFFDDAVLVSRELELTLTGKDCGLETRAPMCGIPYHSATPYISKLIANGHKVAICEQLSNPNESKLVQRDVVQIITPGTILDGDFLVSNTNNFLMTIFGSKKMIGVCYADVSTGFIETTEIEREHSVKLLDDILARVRPSEILVNSEMRVIENSLSSVKAGYIPGFCVRDDIFDFSRGKAKILKQFSVSNLKSLDLDDKKEASVSVGATLIYLEETQKKLISNIKKLSVTYDERFVHLDIVARKNLELTAGSSTNSKMGSLLWVLDKTSTPMGARMLRSFINEPLRDEKIINERLSGVEELADNLILRDSLAQAISGCTDIERKCSRISAGNITPKECLGLAETIEKFPEISAVLLGCNSKILRKCHEKFVDLSDVSKLILSSIDPQAPANLKDGGYILSGCNDELGKLRNAGEFCKQWMAEYEKDQREKTGIKNLKTGYNRVFGYYIEVTNSMLSLVPGNYIRKQTTTGSERFITPELKEMEYKISNAKDRAIELEEKIFSDIKQYLLGFIGQLQEIASSIALCDTLCSFATVAVNNHYVRPVIGDNISHIKIVAGRHPVIELISKDGFSANDTFIDDGENRIMLITGPNMAGKSTYMRQVAIISLMAHMGSFVPAQSAEICILDRVFTRVGASDDLAFGQSTFMVEMSEVSNILSNATSKSLVILDEVGRGTSTYDGMSIAGAIIEYLSSKIHAKTLFSTHYHELTDMEGRVDGVKNYRVMVKELGDSIIFLHKISRGSANRSFGIEVARLAGIPDEVLVRAGQILKETEIKGSSTVTQSGKASGYDESYIPEVINILREMDLNNISPLMAFGTLQNLVDKVKK